MSFRRWNSNCRPANHFFYDLHSPPLWARPKNHRPPDHGWRCTRNRAIVSRRIERIFILALHGARYELTTVSDAIQCIKSYQDDARTKEFERFEIDVRYSNGNSITGKFRDRTSAIEFLRAYQF